MKTIAMKLSSFSVMLLVSMLSHASAAAPSAIDEGAIRDFAQEMAQQHQFDQAELEQLLKNARIHQTILDAISRPGMNTVVSLSINLASRVVWHSGTTMPSP